jgi:hypothetical protein
MAVLSSSRRVVPVESRWLAAAAVGCLCLAGLLSPAGVTDGPVVCPFRRLTGLPCPGCGMTRAWVFAEHGRFGEAIAANPFVLVLLPSAVVFVVAVGLALLGRRRPPDLGALVRRPIAKVVIGGWLTFALVRLLLVATGRASA